MVDAHGGDVAHADEFCCLGPAMSRNNSVGTINEDRTDKSKFFDARCNLLDLLGSVRARIPCPRLQLVGILICNLQRSHGSAPPRSAPRTNRHPSLSTSSRQAAQRNGPGADSAND